MTNGFDETNVKEIHFEDVPGAYSRASHHEEGEKKWQSCIDFIDLGTSYRPSFEELVAQREPIALSDLELSSCSDSGDELFVSANHVLLSRNGTLKRRFTFDPGKEVVQAVFCRFYSGERALNRNEIPSIGYPSHSIGQHSKSAKSGSYGLLRTAATQYLEEHSSVEGGQGDLSILSSFSQSIVIFLDDEAYCYTEDGRSYTVSLPFRLERAWPLNRGLLLERKITKENSSDSYGSSEQEQFLANLSIRSADDIPDRELPKFFTLLDPLLEFGLVAGSRTNDKVDPDETLVLVPDSLNSGLAATYSAESCMLSVYAIYYGQSGKAASMNRKRSTMSRRHSSFVQHGGKDEEAFERRMSARNDMSLTIQRESTSQFPEVADGTAQSLFLQDSHNLDKDIFVRRIETLPFDGSRGSFPSVYSTTNGHQECLIIEDSTNSKLTLLYFEQTSSGATPRYSLLHSISIPAKSSSPLTPSKENPRSFHLLILSVDGYSHILDPWSSELSFKFDLRIDIERLFSFSGNIIRYRQKNKDTIGHLRVQIFPESTFVTRCVLVILAILPPKEASRFVYQWSMSFRNLRVRDEWTAFRIAFVSSWIESQFWTNDLGNVVFESLKDKSTTDNVYNFSLQSSFSEIDTEAYSIADVISMAYMLKKECREQSSSLFSNRSVMVIALQILHEEMLLDISNTKDSKRLRYFIQQLAWWAGWSSHWKGLCDAAAPGHIDKVPRFGCELPEQAQLYPSLYNSLHAAIISHTVPKLLSLKELNIIETGHLSLFPMTNKIIQIYGKLTDSNTTPSDIVEAIGAQGLNETVIRRMPIGIAYPLLEDIAYCRLYTPTRWTSKELSLIDRSDLEILTNPETAPIPSQRLTHNREAHDIRTVVTSIHDSEKVNIFDSSSEHAHIALSRLIFRDDRRLQEASKLLQTTRQHVVTHNELSSLSEQEIIQQRMKLCLACMQRTEAASVGRCPFFYATRKLLITEHFHIPNLNFSVLIRPAMVTTSPDKDDLLNASTSWPLFHTGVCAGLSIRENSPGITGSWITFNRPAELSAKHAGFLLGLGLNNNLKRLEEWHIYNYLGPKHVLTSIGLLLGMCTSYLGSMDPKIVKVLSVHIAALLPPGSRDLNVALPVQTSGLVGLGLLYCGTQNRRMTEVLIGEMEGTGFNRTFQPNEGYMLAAGIGLGLINLAKGHDLRGFQDLGLVQRLLEMAIHARRRAQKQTRDTAPGAIMALTFMFIKSEDKRLAEKIGVPMAESLMDYVRPDILLLRTVAQHVICWNGIKNTRHWILSMLPEFYRQKAENLSRVTLLDSDDLPIYNILVGLAFSMGLKYSSSGDRSSRDTLLYFIDEYLRLTLLPCTTHDQRITRNSLYSGLGLLLLSASTIMVGTGDVDVMRRLRRIHGNLSNPYGLQMACHLSLGITFLGGGQCGFKSSNLALASLMIAFYRQFPSEADETRFHLQAFRHLWVLAVEQRCLVTRELNGQKACVVPVRMKLKSGKLIETSTPCLLPEFDELEKITIDSPDFWPVALDFLVNPGHLRQLRTNQTIYLCRQDIKASNDYSFTKLLRSEDRSEDTGKQSTTNLFGLDQSLKLSPDERRILFLPETSLHDDFSSSSDMVDSKITLEQMSISPRDEEDLWNIRLILDSADSRNRTLHYLDEEFIERLRLRIWQAVNLQSD